jgi:uncharacterized protein DUF5681
MKRNRSSTHRPVKSKSTKHDFPRDYAVGYGRPPIGSRFRPGTSGNAKGRPKGGKNLKTLIRQAMTANISVQEGPTTRRVSKIEGFVLRQLQNALKGNDRSAMAVIKMAMQMGFLEEADNNSAEAAQLSTADEQILQELMNRRQGGKRR